MLVTYISFLGWLAVRKAPTPSRISNAPASIAAPRDALGRSIWSPGEVGLFFLDALNCDPIEGAPTLTWSQNLTGSALNLLNSGPAEVIVSPL